MPSLVYVNQFEIVAGLSANPFDGTITVTWTGGDIPTPSQDL